MTSKIFLIACVLAFSACSTVGPSGSKTDTWNGTLTVGGTTTKTFSIHCSGPLSTCEYAATMTSVSPGATLVELALADANCRVILNSALVTVQNGITGTNLGSGTYCLAVIDLGHLREPETFTVTFTHP